MNKKEKNKRWAQLLIEMRKRGFIEAELSVDEHGNNYTNGNVTTYKCAKSGGDCMFYFTPNYFYNGNTFSLTDGKGGYVYYKGKWVKNTTVLCIREQALESLLE
jgi:Zn-finger protein